MNLFNLILKLMTGQSQGMLNPVDFGNQIILHLKKILKSITILFIGSVIFCLLTGYLIDRTLKLLDDGTFRFTNSIILLLILIAINLVTIVMALKKATAKDLAQSKALSIPVTPAQTSPLETAVAALIFDFIKEREQKRTPPNDA